MAVIRISEADAARDFAGLMARVRAGVEVVIEDGSVAVAVPHMRRVHRTVTGRFFGDHRRGLRP